MLKKILLGLAITLLLLLLLFGVAWYAIQQPKVQNWLAQKACKKLEQTLGTKVQLKNIEIGFFNRLNMNGLLLEDQAKDTLLYADQMQFKVTEFLFGKEKPVITYLALKDAYINLYRSGEQVHPWNFDYIIDKLSGNKKNTDSTTANAGNKDSAASIEFAVRKIDLSNVRIKSRDGWFGQNVTVALGNLQLDAERISTITKQIIVNEIIIDNSDIQYAEFKGGKPPRLKDTSDNSAFNPELWLVNVSKIRFNNAHFQYDHEFAAPDATKFDPEHINIRDINLVVDDLSVQADTIIADIKNLSAKERCGLQIKQCTAHATVSPIRSTLDNLLLVTNNSRIANKYEMIYTRFPDFKHYIDRVIMKADFENCKIAMNDIAYFAPELRKLTVKEVALKRGNFLGTVRDFKSNNIDLQVGNSSLDGNLYIKGLPNIDQTFIVMNSKMLRTSGPELIRFVPQANTQAVAWNQLNRIEFVGDYKGYIRDFTINGNLATNKGNIESNIHLTIPSSKNEVPSYEGTFATNNLKLGDVIKQSAVGTISAKGTIKGAGFDINSVNTYFNGTVAYIETPKYNFRNIDINGTLANKTFTGKIDAQDPNLSMKFDGAVNLATNNPSYKLSTVLTKFDLQKLGVTSMPFSGSARMVLNFSGTNLDNFLGNAKLYDINLNTAKQNIILDSAILKSTQQNGIKNLQLKSDIADAEIIGKFNIEQLPNAAQLFLSKYLPSYIRKPTVQAPQQFDFNIRTKNAEPLLASFIPKLGGCNNARISGNLNMFSQFLNLNAVIPVVSYDGNLFTQVDLQSNGNYDSLTIAGTSNAIQVKDFELLPNTTYNVILKNDSGTIKLVTHGGRDQIRDINLNIQGFAQSGKLYANILPSHFYALNDKWDIYSRQYLSYGNGILSARNINLENGEQRLIVNTSGQNEEDVDISFESLSLDNIKKFSHTTTEVDGFASGRIIISKYQTQRIYSGNIITNEIKVNKEFIGRLNARAQYDEQQQKVIVMRNSGIEYDNHGTAFYGEVDLSGEEAVLDLHAQLDKTNLSIVETFLSGFVSNTKGWASGTIDITGPISKYQINGTVNIKEVSTKINYLGSTYYIDNARIKIDEEKFDFSNSEIYDAPPNTERNVAKITTGYVTHHNFGHLNFDIALVSEKFQFLNTTAMDNSDYYGPVIAKGSLLINGPLENLGLSVIGTTLAGTHLHIPVADEYDAGSYDFIRYKSSNDTSKTSTNLAKRTQEKILKVELIIAVTPEAEISIILDDRTKEMIYGRGEGYLRINIDLGKEFTMDGSIATVAGSFYDYKFTDLIARKLSIEPGGTITWNGDPLKAVLDIDAMYRTRSSLSLAPLIENEAQKAEATAAYPTYVKIHLDGVMLKPEISYDIIQPDNTDFQNPGYAKLQELRKRPELMIQQVSYLLWADQFLPVTSTGGSFFAQTGSSLTNTLLSNISGTVAPTLSNLLTNTLNKNLGTNVGKFDIIYSNQNGGAGLLNTTDNLGIRYSKAFFNDRLQFELDNSVAYNRSSQGFSRNALGDFKLQYKVREDGRLRATVFKTSFNQGTAVQSSGSYIAGAGLIYRKTYNNFRDILGKSTPSVTTPNATIDNVDSTLGTN